MFLVCKVVLINTELGVEVLDEAPGHCMLIGFSCDADKAEGPVRFLHVVVCLPSPGKIDSIILFPHGGNLAKVKAHVEQVECMLIGHVSALPGEFRLAPGWHQSSFP